MTKRRQYEPLLQGLDFLTTSQGLPYRLYTVREVSLLVRLPASEVRRLLTPLFPPLRQMTCRWGKCLWTDDQILGMIDYLYKCPPERMDELKRRISIFSRYPSDSTPTPAVPKRDPKPKP